MASFEVFAMLPCDYEKLADQIIFELSDIDQVIKG